MNNASCFSRAELRSYLLGELPETALDEVALHVEDCRSCEATVAELDSDSDTLIQSLRQPVEPQPPCSAYRLAATRAMSFWRASGELDSDVDDPSAANLPRLRDYELLSQLAEGGMGTVYKARHLRLNRQVALKVLPPRWLKKPALVARFEREMQAVGSLRHDAIVQATDGGEVDGVHFLVMELIDGIDGGALVRCLERLPVADACEIARQAALGMDYVHRQGIIHRDLKPSNLMVTRSGTVKVLDLGLARIVSEQLADDELTTVGQLMGTIDFMAPEQLEDSSGVDEAADIYSLGATLYKLLTGRAPHARQAGEPLLSKLRRVAADPPAPLADHCSDATPELCRLVDSMLSAAAEQRPASMNAVAESLAEFSQSSDLVERVKEAAKIKQRSRRSNRPDQRSHSDFASLITNPSVASESAIRPPRGQKYLAAAAAASLLLAIVLGVVIKVQSSIGQLVIETNSPGVEVRVLKAGEPYRQLTLEQQANTVRLGAGQYEIEIVSDADGIAVQNGRYTLNKGETWLAKIIHRSEQIADSDAGLYPTLRLGQQPLATAEPTYEGRTLGQWLGLLRTERSPQQFSEACMALKKLATGKDCGEAATAMLIALRSHSGPTRISRVTLWDTGESFLKTCDQAIVVDAINTEFDQGSKANIDFILYYLTKRSDAIRSAADSRLISKVERIAADPQSDSRQQALLALQSIAPEDVAVRRLVSALSDLQIDIQLYAARTLIGMKSNTPLVVSALRRVMRGDDLGQRAQAAWLLGDLGADAEPALPELLACIEDDDFKVSAEGVYGPPISGLVSVKDAAIRAIAQIGDESAVPALISEWQRRATGADPTHNKSAAWIRDQQISIANSYDEDWVEDAIETLIGMHPELASRRGSPPVTEWMVENLSLERAFRAAFVSVSGQVRLDLIDIAKRLLPKSSQMERARAMAYVEHIYRFPGPKELEQEIEMIELIATVDPFPVVLPPLFHRWGEMMSLSDNGQPGTRAATQQAYKDCSTRILRQSDNWKSTAAPFLVKQIQQERALAAMLFLELIDEFELQQQLDGIVATIELISQSGIQPLSESIDRLASWLEEESNRTEIRQIIDQSGAEAFENLVVGLLRSGLADDEVKKKLTDRFAEERIQRRGLIARLIGVCADQPNLPEVIIGLIKHPALDEHRGFLTLRCHFFSVLGKAPSECRDEFRPYLQSLLASEKSGEAAAAKEVLHNW